MIVPVLRHLNDVDDLSKPGRDGNLIEGQEEEARIIAHDIYSNMIKDGKRAVFMICSPKIRAIQTAKLIQDEIYKKDKNFKVRIVSDSNLSSLFEGEFILPNNYIPGDRFETLPKANKIFHKETFDLENPNELYRFGDPVKQEV